MGWVKCDRCPARARWWFKHPSRRDFDGEPSGLHLCQHHAGAHAAEVRMSGWFTYRLAKEPQRV